MHKTPGAHCGAKTRAGEPCKNAPMRNGRCRLHGGKTPFGIASPHYRHGFYSKYLPTGLLARLGGQEARVRERAERLARVLAEHERLAAAARAELERRSFAEWSDHELERLAAAAGGMVDAIFGPTARRRADVDQC